MALMLVARRIAESDKFVRAKYKGWAPMLLLGGGCWKTVNNDLGRIRRENGSCRLCEFQRQGHFITIKGENF